MGRGKGLGPQLGSLSPMSKSSAIQTRQPLALLAAIDDSPPVAACVAIGEALRVVVATAATPTAIHLPFSGPAASVETKMTQKKRQKTVMTIPTSSSNLPRRQAWSPLLHPPPRQPHLAHVSTTSTLRAFACVVVAAQTLVALIASMFVEALSLPLFTCPAPLPVSTGGRARTGCPVRRQSSSPNRHARLRDRAQLQLQARPLRYRRRRQAPIAATRRASSPRCPPQPAWAPSRANAPSSGQ